MKAKKVVVGLGVRKPLGTFPKRLREERRLKHRGLLQHVGTGSESLAPGCFLELCYEKRGGK